MSSIFTIGPVSPEAFTVWSIDDGIVVEMDGTDETTAFGLPAQAA